MKLALLILLSCLPLLTLAQTKVIDSLERRVSKVTGAEKVLTYAELTFQLYQVDARRAEKYGIKAIDLALKLKDPALIAQAKNDASIAYIALGDFKKALRLNEEALGIRQQLKDTNGIISSYSKMGQCQSELSHLSEAAKDYMIALDLLKGREQPVKEMQLFGNLAGVYESLGQWEEAYQLAKDALKLAREMKHEPSIISTQGTLATVARKLKRYDESIRLFKELIPLCERTNSIDFLTTVYQGLGLTYRESGDVQTAISYYLKAYAIFEKLDSKYSMGSVSGNLGYAYMKLKDLEKAEKYFLLGEKYLQHTGSFKHLRSVYQGLTQLYKEKKEFEQSLHYAEETMKYMDSTYSTEGNTIMSNMFAKYQTEKKERELAIAKLKNAEKDKTIARTALKAEQEKAQRWIWLLLTITIGIVASIIVRDLLRKRKAALAEVEETLKKEELKREQELNEQKLSISRELHDNIGSQLTYMISSMDNLTYKFKGDNQLTDSISELSNFGRETMQELRSTIWAMNTEDGSVDLLFRKLEELRSRIPIELKLENRLSKPIPLKAVEILNLYRIGQEAIQNTLKYANASVISIQCDQAADETFRLSISDNGTGFENTNQNTGNGLTNMRYRCEQLGGVFTIHSSTEGGTTISCALRHLSY